MVKLNDLPRDHPARNVPLAAHKARYRAGSGPWRVVEPAYKIARNTFNELAACWVVGWDWELDQ